jgi:hypothetical protein
MRDARPRLLAATFALFVLLPFPSASVAQAGLGHLEDATLPPRGLLRVRGITAWTRYDERFTSGGTELLGAPLTTDAFGVATFAPLASIQSLIQAASGTPFTLSMGRSRFDATGREEIVPMALEYGITSRLALGVMVPVVRKRIAQQFVLDSTGANVGPNPARTSSAASQLAAQLQAEFTNAQALLSGRLQSCQSNPSGPGCATLLSRQAEAQALIQSSQTFASDVGALYGTSSTNGMAFVPRAQSAAQIAIAARIADFNTRYQDLLQSSANFIVAVPRGAGGAPGSAQFQSYLFNDLGRDSLTFRERIGIGDIEVGFRAGLIDHMSAGRLRGIRLTLASAVRLPTGSRQSPSDIADLRLGEGSYIVDSRIALDSRTGRLGLLAVGDFAANVHSNDTTNASIRNTRWTEIQLQPRWHLSEALAIHAAYSLRSTDKFGGDQLVGGGISFSTLSAYRRGSRAHPIETRFTHLEAISGDAGRPKFFRDQIELRFYFRPR